MSRSNPTLKTPHPSTRWFEWKGGDNSGLQYYDKEKKETVPVALPFTFLLLEETGGVVGYNKKLKTGIRSNEIQQGGTLVVKYGNGATFASGHWMDIKDKVKGAGGKFSSNIYLAYKDGSELKIGVLRASGCALGPWFDFTKANREMVISPFDGKTELARIYSGAVVMKAGKLDESGAVAFTPSTFAMVACSQESNLAALALSAKVDKYLAEYFKRAPMDDPESHEDPEPESEPEQEPEPDPLEPAPDDDSLPF